MLAVVSMYPVTHRPRWLWSWGTEPRRCPPERSPLHRMPDLGAAPDDAVTYPYLRTNRTEGAPSVLRCYVDGGAGCSFLLSIIIGHL